MIHNHTNTHNDVYYDFYDEFKQYYNHLFSYNSLLGYNFLDNILPLSKILPENILINHELILVMISNFSTQNKTLKRCLFTICRCLKKFFIVILYSFSIYFHNCKYNKFNKRKKAEFCFYIKLLLKLFN